MTHKDIIEKKDFFQDITWHHLSNGLKAFECGELLSACVWATVFVESLLKDILSALLNKDFSEDELYSLIGTLRSIMNNGGAKSRFSSEDATRFRLVITAAEEIRLKRNRLVHDTGAENTALDSDANDVFKNIGRIVTHFTQTELSKATCAQKKNIPVLEQAAPEPTFSMFLSTITPHTFEQSEFIESFCDRLRSIGIKPVRCKMTDFDRRKPMEKARQYIEKCNGIIVLGLERSHSYFFKDREGSAKESEAVHRHYSSAWLQLETGMAIGMGKEVFVLCQRDLYSDGIFDRDWNSYTPIELDLPLNINDPKITEMLQVLEEFKENFEG